MSRRACSVSISMVTGESTELATVANSTLREPDSWSMTSWAVSSTSTYSPSARVPIRLPTWVTGPSSHCTRSRVWIAWFISTPPPLRARWPRQGPRA